MLYEWQIGHIILLGAASECIEASLKQAGVKTPVHQFSTFETAIEKALALSKPADAVLLSPACASYDMFPNFIERGLSFKSQVLAWQA